MTSTSFFAAHDKPLFLNRAYESPNRVFAVFWLAKQTSRFLWACIWSVTSAERHTGAADDVLLLSSGGDFLKISMHKTIWCCDEY